MKYESQFYLDEHLPSVVAEGLEQRGIEVTTVVEADMRTASDEDHLAYAVQNGYTIVTRDADFLQLVTGVDSHPGVVFLPRVLDVGTLIRSLTELARTHSRDDLKNRVHFL